MPSQADYAKVADALKGQLGRRPFLTLTRRDVTETLRTVSGEPNTRIKVLAAQAIADELAERGLVFYPDLYEVGSNDSVRLFRTDSFIMELVSIVNDPSESNDIRLSKALRTTLPKAEKAAANEPELATA